MLSDLKPPACRRPPDVGIQPWAVSLDSSSCPLFTTSLHIGEEDAESRVYTPKSSKTRLPTVWLTFILSKHWQGDTFFCSYLAKRDCTSARPY